MRQKISYWCATLLFAILGVSCGGDDSSSVSSGVPASQPLSALGEQDARKVCNAYADNFRAKISQDDFKRYSCTFAASIAVAFSGNGMFDVAKCDMLVASCVSGEKGPGQVSVSQDADSGPECSGSDWLSKVNTCEATVGEFEACATRVIDTFAAEIKQAKCEAPELDQSSSSSEEDKQEQVPAECKALLEKCSELFDAMDSSDADASSAG